LKEKVEFLIAVGIAIPLILILVRMVVKIIVKTIYEEKEKAKCQEYPLKRDEKSSKPEPNEQ